MALKLKQRLAVSFLILLGAQEWSTVPHSTRTITVTTVMTKKSNTIKSNEGADENQDISDETTVNGETTVNDEDEECDGDTTDFKPSKINDDDSNLEYTLSRFESDQAEPESRPTPQPSVTRSGRLVKPPQKLSLHQVAVEADEYSISTARLIANVMHELNAISATGRSVKHSISATGRSVKHSSIAEKFSLKAGLKKFGEAGVRQKKR